MDSLIVNERTVPVFPADTESTMRERIAALLDTTPFYLWIRKAGREVPFHGEWTAVDVYRDIRSKSFNDVTAAVNFYNEWFSSSDDNEARKLRYKAISRAVVEGMAATGSDPDAISLLMIDMPPQEARNIIVEKENYRKKHEERVSAIKARAESVQLELYDNTEDGSMSQLVIEAMRNVCEMRLTRTVPIPAIFDSLVPVPSGQGIVFARMGKFIKHHQAVNPPPSALSFSPDESTSDLEECNLVIGATLPKDAGTGKFTTFRMWYEKMGDGKVASAVHVSRQRHSLVVEFNYRHGGVEALTELVAYIPALTDLVTSHRDIMTSTVATMVRPKFTFVTELLTHFILLDRRNGQMTVDERLNPNRGRVHIVFGPERQRVSLAVERSNQSSEPFTRVRFYDSKNLERLEPIRLEIISMLNKYKAVEVEIDNKYNRYLPAVVDRCSVRVMRDSTRNRIRREVIRPYLEQAEQMPELFVPYYTRSCAQARLPKIVGSPTEAGTADIHKFPIKKEAGLEPQLMVCPSRYPNFGLMNNSLNNSDEFEYIPCCYAKDTTKQPSMLHYYNDEDRVERTRQSLYVTGRILPLSSYGTLPPAIATHFNVLGSAPRNLPFYMIPDFKGSGVGQSDKDGDHEIRAVRCGVNRGPNCFIEAVIRALHIQEYAHQKAATEVYNPPTLNEDDLVKIRLESLAQLQNMSAQETWDLDIQCVFKWLVDSTLYIDPRRFVRLLEHHFGINIYLFERNARRITELKENKELRSNGGGVELQWTVHNETPNGCMIVPPHCPDGPYFHCKRKDLPAWKNVYLYIHEGSDVDRGRSEPHVEYIITDNEDAAKLAYEMFCRLAITTQKIAARFDALQDNLTKYSNRLSSITQVLDRGGRCVQIDGVTVEPMAPLPVKVALRGRYDLASRNPHHSLKGKSILQRIGRMYLNTLIRTRAGGSNEAKYVIDATAFAFPTGRIMTGFNTAKWKIEDVVDVVLDNNQHLVVDSEDTMKRLIRLSDVVINRMTQDERLAAAARSYISGYFHNIDDFTRRPGQLISLVRLKSATAPLVDEVPVLYGSPAPVRNGQDVVYITTEMSGPQVEILMRAVHGEAAMMRLINPTGEDSATSALTNCYVWDGNTFQSMYMKGSVAFDGIFVYKSANTTIFLVTKKNKNAAATRAIENMRH